MYRLEITFSNSCFCQKKEKKKILQKISRFQTTISRIDDKQKRRFYFLNHQDKSLKDRASRTFNNFFFWTSYMIQIILSRLQWIIISAYLLELRQSLITSLIRNDTISRSRDCSHENSIERSTNNL